MSEPKFTPRVQELIKASPPHPPDTYYRVGIGPEDWGDGCTEVEKVQMVYAGKVAGRKVPSYPLGTDDSKRVSLARERLQNRERAEGKSSAGTDREQRPLALVDLIGSAKGLYGTPEDVQRARDELRREWP